MSLRAQRYLYSLEGRGMKFGLRNIRFLLAHTDHPERKFRSVHIAGTNGKGSTSSFLASTLMECGLKTGLYTSPHLIRFSERIRINGKEISEDRLLRYVEELKPLIEETRATFFEATTCIAFQYFADEAVDIAVIETGLGGRLDATNVLTPVVSVITSISFDHTEILGNTIASIAREKGGIIKPGIPCVTSSVNPVALRTLNGIALRRATRVRSAGTIARLRPTIDDERVQLSGRHWKTKLVKLGLTGLHQRQNAQLAASAFAVMPKSIRSSRAGLRVSALQRGLEQVRSNTGFRGRCEQIAYKRFRVVLDVAHNPGGAQVVAEALSDSGTGKYIVVIGVLRDKDARGIVQALRTLATHFVCVTPRSKRAMTGRELASIVRELSTAVSVARDAPRGLEAAFRRAGPDSTVLVTGSHYVVGEALAVLENNSIAATNRLDNNKRKM